MRDLTTEEVSKAIFLSLLIYLSLLFKNFSSSKYNLFFQKIFVSSEALAVSLSKFMENPFDMVYVILGARRGGWFFRSSRPVHMNFETDLETLRS